MINIRRDIPYRDATNSYSLPNRGDRPQGKNGTSAPRPHE